MKATIRDVIRMREDGRPRKWIVRETGLHWMTVRSMLSLAGNPPQKQEVYNEKAYDVADDAWPLLLGECVWEISKDLTGT